MTTRVKFSAVIATGAAGICFAISPASASAADYLTASTEGRSAHSSAGAYYAQIHSAPVRNVMACRRAAEMASRTHYVAEALYYQHYGNTRPISVAAVPTITRCTDIDGNAKAVFICTAQGDVQLKPVLKAPQVRCEDFKLD